MSKAEIEAQIANLQNSLRDIEIKEALEEIKAKGFSTNDILNGLGINPSQIKSRFPYPVKYTYGGATHTYFIQNENEERLFKIFNHLLEKIGVKYKVFDILFPSEIGYKNLQRYVVSYLHLSPDYIPEIKRKAMEYCRMNSETFKESVSYLSSI